MSRSRPIVASRRSWVLMPVSAALFMGFTLSGPTWAGLLFGVCCLATCAAGLEWNR